MLAIVPATSGSKYLKLEKDLNFLLVKEVGHVWIY